MPYIHKMFPNCASAFSSAGMVGVGAYTSAGRSCAACFVSQCGAGYNNTLKRIVI